VDKQRKLLEQFRDLTKNFRQGILEEASSKGRGGSTPRLQALSRSTPFSFQ
jgi:hypothetical protein